MGKVKRGSRFGRRRRGVAMLKSSSCWMRMDDVMNEAFGGRLGLTSIRKYWLEI